LHLLEDALEESGQSWEDAVGGAQDDLADNLSLDFHASVLEELRDDPVAKVAVAGAHHVHHLRHHIGVLAHILFDAFEVGLYERAEVFIVCDPAHGPGVAFAEQGGKHPEGRTFGDFFASLGQPDGHFVDIVAGDGEEGEGAAEVVVVAAVELGVGAFDEGDGGSFDDEFEVVCSMRVEALDGVDDAFAAFEFLAVEDPDLYAALDVGVVLELVHLADGLEAHAVQTALDHHR
jgi:hypothetical protein